MVLRRLLCVSLSALAFAACNAIVGFDDFERVGADAAPAEAEPSTPDAAPRDAEVVEQPGVEAGPDAPELASTTCPAPAPAYYPPWKSPAPRAKPCTPSDLTTFVTHEGQTFESQKAAMEAQNAACAACVFTLESDDEWGPIVKTNDGRVFVSFGHCYARAGAPDTCGDGAHELEWCLQKICNVCSDGQSLADCRLVEREGGCKRGLDRTLAACGNNSQIINNTCRGSGDVVAVLCGGK
ncbi:MAG: hypothetical protein KIS78_22785 [Labilithrix sp.]|nr:hypothetical protein [Labilithrix sp.]